MSNELLKEGKQKEAISLYELNINEMTISNNTYSKLFKIYLDSEKFDDAQRICKQAIEVYKPLNHSKVSRYRYNLLRVYDKRM